MSVIGIQIVQAGAPIPTGTTRASTNVVVTDSSGLAQKPVVLNGSESPPWSLTATVTGSGTVTASDIDSNGNVIGTPVTQAYSITGGTGSTALATSSINVTTVTP